MPFLKPRLLWHSLIHPYFHCMPCHEFLSSSRPLHSSPFSSLVLEGGWNWSMVSLLMWLCLCNVTLKLYLAWRMSYVNFLKIHKVGSSSMSPTLRVNDEIVADMVSCYFQCPSIHDIVLFTAPQALLQDDRFSGDELFIKRIVAKAGDTVEVHSGSVFINGIAQDEDFISEPPNFEMGATQVPEGHVYVLGDNRNDSNDSHVWGPLPIANIVGQYVMHVRRIAHQ